MDRCFVLCESNIVLKADGSLPGFSELEKIKAENPVQEYFEEKNTGIKVLGLVSAENLGSAYKIIAMREFFAENAADEEVRFQVFRAKSLLNWRVSAKYCQYCGKPSDESAVICPVCGKPFSGGYDNEAQTIAASPYPAYPAQQSSPAPAYGGYPPQPPYSPDPAPKKNIKPKVITLSVMILLAIIAIVVLIIVMNSDSGSSKSDAKTASLEGTYEWTHWVTSSGNTYDAGDLRSSFDGTVTLTIDEDNHGVVLFPSGHEDTLTLDPDSNKVTGYRYGDTYEFDGDSIVITNSDSDGYREEYTRQ